ncbi:hypothetical protein [Clostridium grantii]|uniref:Uncharacterized protein n=1 Tax=Clostridium grantii DSM 8605 TaxID=1121316 RepID=A0A1M5Y5X7_9CLOT|nr:hypothetical protein [Clostridium grantii]SHI07402.1 hypothetical protein SAMN02745207_04220 [Clostridium grantii DSM 8605]
MVILKKLSLDMKVLLSIIVILFIGSWTYMYLSKPYYVDTVYGGIRYQASNMDFQENIDIEIKGEYIQGLFGQPDKFSGKILIRDKELDYSDPPIPFQLNNMAVLPFGQINNGISGVIYIDENLNKVTIEIAELNEQGNSSFHYDNGWLISAPSDTREEAVRVSNELIQKMYQDLVVR